MGWQQVPEPPKDLCLRPHLALVADVYNAQFDVIVAPSPDPDIKPAQIKLDDCKANHRLDVLLYQICILRCASIS